MVGISCGVLCRGACNYSSCRPMGRFWAMFLLGFLAMLIFTYIHGLGLPNWLRWSIVIAYFVFMIFIYVPLPFGFGRGIANLLRLEFLWIPIILFLIAFIAAAIAHVYVIIRNKRSSK